MYETEHYTQPASAGGLKSWVVHGLMGMLNSIMLYSLEDGLVPCSRQVLGGPLRVASGWTAEGSVLFLGSISQSLIRALSRTNPLQDRLLV